MKVSTIVRVFAIFCTVVLAPTTRADEATLSVQQQLHAQGTYSGPIDGKPSEQLTKALKDFQQRHQLSATGVLDQETAKALDDENGLALPDLSNPPAAAKTSATTPTATPSATSEEDAAQREQDDGYGSTPTPTTSPARKAIASATPTPLPTPSNSPVLPVTTLAPTPNDSRPATEREAAPPISPAPPEEAPAQFASERVTAFLRDFVNAGEGKNVTPQLRFYSFPVNYFARGKVSAGVVRGEILRNLRRWPRRSYKLVEPVSITAANGETATVDFTVAYTVQRGKQKTSGRRKTRVTLREVNRELKIVAINAPRG